MDILIVEDNIGLREQMKWALSDIFTVHEAGNSEECIQVAKEVSPMIICLDMGLDNIPDKGLELIDRLIESNRNVKIVVITAHTSESMGRDAINRGAFDYLKKPVNIEALKVILKRGERILELEEEKNEDSTREEGMQTADDSYMIGQSKPMQQIYTMIRRLGENMVNVLITGESGTGKEMCARAIHHNSSRNDQSFVPINCGAIPDNLLESELFGYSKGAFTGANTNKKGLIAAADNGTLFLDEIGEMDKHLQVKLLRYIEDQTYQPLGDTKILKSTARIIAATNRDVSSDTEKSPLRSDLYYRLSEFEIDLPLLKDRGDDVLLIANRIIERNREKFNIPKLSLSTRAQKTILNYRWPGNVRELENKISKASIICSNQTIEPEDLHIPTERMKNMKLKEARNQIEKEFIINTLKDSENNISSAAKILGISRPTLYDLLKKHNIQ